MYLTLTLNLSQVKNKLLDVLDRGLQCMAYSMDKVVQHRTILWPRKCTLVLGCATHIPIPCNGGAVHVLLHKVRFCSILILLFSSTYSLFTHYIWIFYGFYFFLHIYNGILQQLISQNWKHNIIKLINVHKNKHSVGQPNQFPHLNSIRFFCILNSFKCTLKNSKHTNQNENVQIHTLYFIITFRCIIHLKSTFDLMLHLPKRAQ